MPELSQLVRQRLASRGTAGNHPDADTLTAYTEQLLSSGERRQVLEHIAACAKCREIVALSLPDEVESLPATAVAAPRRGWRWKPALGLAVSLATLALATTLILELPRKPAPPDSVRQSAAPANTAEADKTAPPTTQPEAATAGRITANSPVASSKTTAAASATRANTANKDASARAATAAPPVVSANEVPAKRSSSPVVEARLNERDYVNKQMFDAGQQGNSDAVPSVAEIPSAPLPRLAVQSQFPPPLSSNAPLTFADLPPQVQNGKVVRSRQFSNLPNNHFGIGLIPNLPALGRKAETLARRSLAIQPGALSHSAMESNNLNPSREAQPVDSVAAKEAPGGDLDESSAFSPHALAGAAAPAAAWKVTGGSLMKSTDATTWNAGYGPADIEFTFVAARGANVWAGGANAALVHSTNNGISWERVTLGASATGSVTSIEFGPANVHVKSSSGQEWFSQDAGKTWSMEK